MNTAHLDPALAVKDAIHRTVASMCGSEWANGLRACILTGSLARNEATVVQEFSGWRILGDAEFLAVFREGTPLPGNEAVAKLCASIENSLAGQGIKCHIFIGAVSPKYLAELRPHIFGYELRECGEVIYGEEGILSLIPSFGAADIPLEDAWWLLSNRMIELIEAVADSVESEPLTTAYRASKFYLDMATSFLIFQGAYEPGYAKRANTLTRLAESGPGSPFSSLKRFAKNVTRSTELKVGVAEAEGFADFIWEELVEDGRQLWRWELARLTGLPGDASDSQLRRALFRGQKLSRALLGWAYVFRKSGWRNTWRYWPHWLQMARQGSPRYCVYGIASELFFELPRLLRYGDTGRSWAALRSRLPVDPGTNGSRWNDLAAALSWNYHQFLELTRL